MYPESTTGSPARLSLRQTGSPGMIYRNLGKSGLRVSCLGLGTWVTFGGQITDEVRRGSRRLQVPAEAGHGGHLVESAPWTTGPALTVAAAASLVPPLKGAVALWVSRKGEGSHSSIKRCQIRCLPSAAGCLGASVIPKRPRISGSSPA